MRISDWSSDVCSSDLCAQRSFGEAATRTQYPHNGAAEELIVAHLSHSYGAESREAALARRVSTASTSAGHASLDTNGELNNIRGAGQLFPSTCATIRSEEHTSELQSLLCLSYAVFCLQQLNKKKTLD